MTGILWSLTIYKDFYYNTTNKALQEIVFIITSCSLDGNWFWEPTMAAKWMCIEHGWLLEELILETMMSVQWSSQPIGQCWLTLHGPNLLRWVFRYSASKKCLDSKHWFIFGFTVSVLSFGMSYLWLLYVPQTSLENVCKLELHPCINNCSSQTIEKKPEKLSQKSVWTASKLCPNH